MYLKRKHLGTGFTTALTIQMLAGGVALALVGFLRGEQHHWHPTTQGLAALGYLIVFGAIVGFTAYGYALRHASATVLRLVSSARQPSSSRVGRAS